MDLLLVRHGESEANREGRLQGREDHPLSEQGRAQARTLAAWLRARDVTWDHALSSPLVRASETAAILTESSGRPLEFDPDLMEISMGALEGLKRDDIGRRFPEYLARPLPELGNFSNFGGESYEDVQRRVARVCQRLIALGAERVLVVAHGGFLFQLLKSLICDPVPRVAIIRWGNCTVGLVRMRERRGSYLGELMWQVPVEFMGARANPGTSGVFG